MRHLLIPILIIPVLFLLIVTVNEASAFGETGLYLTKVKVEYQYSDYGDYKFPEIAGEDSVKYEYIDPYILNFPENRALAKITQAFGPFTSVELRHEYSDLTELKDQNRTYLRLDRDINDLTSLYAAYQHMKAGYDSPDSNSSTGNMVSLGVKYDRSGWIKGEVSFSYDNSEAPDGITTKSYMPMVKLRWSINSVTALSVRWDGYWSENVLGTYPAHAFNIFVSRYLPTQTAVHVFARFYRNDYGVESVSPAVELAQYIRWNLTARLTYRLYRNWFDEENAPDFVDGGSITSHAIRSNIEWQFRDDMRLALKFRWYTSDQDIQMNTYLIGMEYEL